MKHDKKLIGERIKKIQLSLGDTNREFGQRFEPPANRGNVSKWHNGKSLPNINRLQQIADLGGITIQELMYGSKYLPLSHFSNDELISELHRRLSGGDANVQY